MSCRRLVFDTGPLSSFAVIAQLDLLEAVCAGHGSWPLSVQRELRAGAAAQPALAGVLQAAFLGVPEVLYRAMLAAGRRPGRASRDWFGP